MVVVAVFFMVAHRSALDITEAIEEAETNSMTAGGEAKIMRIL